DVDRRPALAASRAQGDARGAADVWSSIDARRLTTLPTAMRRIFLFAALLASAGCARRGLPDPRAAAEEYARAAERGDADAIYGMLTTSAQQSRSREDIQRL